MNISKFNAELPGFHKQLLEDLYYEQHRLQSSGYYKLQDEQTYSYLSIDLKQASIHCIITFHPFYRVPVLYFKVLKGKIDDKTTRALSLGSISSIFPDFWPENVTMEAPEVVPGVWFCIHPCETSAQMGQLLPQAPAQYFRLWFAFYGLQAAFPSISLRSTMIQ